MVSKVEFFIAGVQKGGTTALDAYLRCVPGIQMARKKEVHFFDKRPTDWTAPSYERLEEQFCATDAMRGEATPIYTYWPDALERLQRYNPSAKLIVLLRHPAYRAYSHWRMEVTRGEEQLNFSAAISDEGRRRVSSAPNGVHRVFSYVERGFYASQIRRLLSLFPREQLCFLATDELWNDAKAAVGAVCSFLGGGIVPTSLARAYRAPFTSDPMPPIAESDLSYLMELYATDIGETSVLTGLSLGRWQERGYREPMIAFS